MSDLEEMMEDIPRLINSRFAHVCAQLDAIDARVGTVEVKLDGVLTEMQSLRREFPDLIAAAVGEALGRK